VVSKFPKEKISTDLHNVARIVVQGNAPVVSVPQRRSWLAQLVSRTSNA